MGKYLDVGEKGVHFQDVAENVAKQYMKKGVPKEKAMEIGKRVAGAVFWRKFGKRRGKKIISKAKRIARASRRRR